ncbi:hypothetical protein [Vibrio phage YC]|uniref:Uncharacterized protein n=1 Tax=Vibrio phage YC TaxID=2267403 RepID=A0A384ZSB2_9CAUD|nr:hypothetical protein HWB64_gp159 [Vibrio phage YC]AXC34528.1 hypothetical protein [Vibrio phage YC]
MDIKHPAITVSLTCILTALTMFSTESFRQGGEATKVEAVIKANEAQDAEIRELRDAVLQINTGVEGLIKSVDELKDEVSNMQLDVNRFTVFIAEERTRREVMKELSGETH